MSTCDQYGMGDHDCVVHSARTTPEPSGWAELRKRPVILCRTCLRSLTWDTRTEPGFLPRTGFYDDAATDPLVCFKAADFRHDPLTEREWNAMQEAVVAQRQQVATESRFDSFDGYYSARFSGIEFARFAPSPIWSDYATSMQATQRDFSYAFISTRKDDHG